MDQHLDRSISEHTRKKIEELTLKLPVVTLSIKDGIFKLRDDYKLFTKTAATTSKNSFVTNIFVYKKRDALKTCVSNYEEIRKLVTVFDIKSMPYINEKIGMAEFSARALAERQ